MSISIHYTACSPQSQIKIPQIDACSGNFYLALQVEVKVDPLCFHSAEQNTDSMNPMFQ